MGENFKTLCEGAYYVDAEGREYGPAVKRDRTAFPFLLESKGDYCWFSETGNYIAGEHNKRDLVRVLPDKDGWYPHVPGDPQPVGDDVEVEAKLKDDYSLVRTCAETWNWSNCGDSSIVKYRIVSEQKSPQASGASATADGKAQAQPAVMSVHDTPADAPSGGAPGVFKRGDLVKKRGEKGQWHGVICGEYSTSVTPEGYCVRSLLETDSVQIYPVEALEPWDGIYTIRFGRED